MRVRGEGVAIHRIRAGLGLLVLVFGCTACTAPPLLQQYPSSVPMIEEQGDLVVEGAVTANREESMLGFQGHLTWAPFGNTAIRVGGSTGDDEEIADSTAHDPNADPGTADYYSETRSQFERDIALGWFFLSDDRRRVTELYIGRAEGAAAGAYKGAPCARNCDVFSSENNMVYGDYSRSYLDLNSVWKLDSRQRWLLGFSTRLAQYDPYNMGDVNGTRVDAGRLTTLEPSILTGFRVGDFQLIGQYATAIEILDGPDEYEMADGVLSMRLQWRIW